MRTTTGSVHSQFPRQPVSPNYSPSVPLSVYRELAAELQAAQAKLDALNLKNQQITQENQHLRQEIAQVVKACLHLQKLLDDHQPQPNYQPDISTVNRQPAQESDPPTTTTTTPTPSNYPVDSPPVAEVKRMKKPPVTVVPPRQKASRPRPPKASAPKKIRREEFYVPVVDVDFPIPEPVFIEEQEVRYYTTIESEPKELSNLWLIIFIVLIIITGFAAGYLIVRPLFVHPSR